MITYTFVQLLSQNAIDAEKLAYIDFKLFFTGTLSRTDIGDTFGLKEASASRLIAEYKTLRPNNIEPKAKLSNINIEKFEPLIRFEPYTALDMLTNGFSKNRLLKRASIQSSFVGINPNLLNIDTNTVSIITRAIHGKYAISCKYLSRNSENHTTREVKPLCLVFDGKHWMFRAFNSSDGQFKNFNFSRVREPLEKPSIPLNTHEELDNDPLWNRQIPLQLEIHPSLTEREKEEIRIDYAIDKDSDELVITERAALIFLLKKTWHIDDGQYQNSQEKPYFRFKLKNAELVNSQS